MVAVDDIVCVTNNRAFGLARIEESVCYPRLVYLNVALLEDIFDPSLGELTAYVGRETRRMIDALAIPPIPAGTVSLTMSDDERDYCDCITYYRIVAGTLVEADAGEDEEDEDASEEED